MVRQEPRSEPRSLRGRAFAPDGPTRFIDSFGRYSTKFAPWWWSVSQSLPHSYQRSTWPTVHSIFLVQRDLWTDYPVKRTEPRGAAARLAAKL